MNKNWIKILTLTASSTYLYTFMEWIFFATKPSFMSSMNVGQKVMVFFVASFVLTVLILTLTVLAIILLKLLKISVRFAAVIPALLFSLLALILLDNFTYTVLKFGVVTSQGIVRGVYAAGLLFVFTIWLRNIWHNLRQPFHALMPYFV